MWQEATPTQEEESGTCGSQVAWMLVYVDLKVKDQPIFYGSCGSVHACAYSLPLPPPARKSEVALDVCFPVKMQVRKTFQMIGKEGLLRPERPKMQQFLRNRFPLLFVYFSFVLNMPYLDHYTTDEV